MSPSNFSLSPDALNDLDEIWLFIAKDSIEAAERNEDDLQSAMRRLARNPGMGHSRPDITDQPVAFWPSGSYLIVYETESTPLHIVRVLHGARDASSLL